MQQLGCAALMCAILLFGTASLAQGADRPLTKEQIDQLDSSSRIIERVDQLRRNIEVLSRARATACLRAFGHDRFCDCINEKLPYSLTFDDYIQVVTRTNEQLAAAKLDKEQRKLADLAVKARDVCVTSTLHRQ
jgi:hypothetical protein